MPSVTDPLDMDFSTLNAYPSDLEFDDYFSLPEAVTATEYADMFDHFVDWSGTASIPVPSQRPSQPTFPGFGEYFGVHDADYLAGGFASPVSPTDGYWSASSPEQSTFAQVKAEPKSASSPASTSGESSRGVKRLRTTTPRSKAKKPSRARSSRSPSEDDLPAPKDQRARQSHNIIEKQYRNRLNSQFELLLAILPTDRRMDDGEAPADADDRHMSKSEVLDLARRRVEALQRDHARLLGERASLLGAAGALRQPSFGAIGCA